MGQINDSCMWAERVGCCSESNKASTVAVEYIVRRYGGTFFASWLVKEKEKERVPASEGSHGQTILS